MKLLALARRDDHQLGFEVPDEQYFAETSQYTTIPEFFLTPRFLKVVSRAETLPQAKALLREMNATRAPGQQLIFFSYTSRHLGTPDNRNSFRRLLIIVPGDSAQRLPEKWVQFGIADPGKPRSVRNVSVVAVLANNDQTANVYFKDFYRTYRRSGVITIKGRWELGEGDDNCVTCHKSDGTGRGPKLEGLFGSTVHLDNGQTVKADESYVRESILDSQSKIVAGYSRPSLMPTFQSVVNEEQLSELLAYLKSIGPPAQANGTATPGDAKPPGNAAKAGVAKPSGTR